MENVEQQEREDQRELMDPLAHQAQQEAPVHEDLQEMLEKMAPQEREVHRALMASMDPLVSWGHRGNQGPRV